MALIDYTRQVTHPLPHPQTIAVPLPYVPRVAKEPPSLAHLKHKDWFKGGKGEEGREGGRDKPGSRQIVSLDQGTKMLQKGVSLEVTQLSHGSATFA